MNSSIVAQLKTCLTNNSQITFLVGAGISAESGIPTFRGADGYWTVGSVNYKAEEIGTYNMFSQSPQEVWKWYLYRKSITHKAQPNASHKALVNIEQLLGQQYALISQNVDSLHRRAGSSEEHTFLIHGDFDFVRCASECTSKLIPFPNEINLENRDKHTMSAHDWEALTCPNCGDKLRPHVLWFDEYYNEVYYKFDTALRTAEKSQLLFILGSSGATTLPQMIAERVLAKGGMVVEVNINESYFSQLLKSQKNGIVINSKSSPFLLELESELKALIHNY
ncbi:MAG: iron dicitrate transport regulator FecR [Flavobacteriales bacterium]|jgi:NAD-dependent deacetylase|nr:iron dicitrate transport regulator FecR [Flavobacteriales bacterium]